MSDPLWQPVRPVRDGEPADAATIGRPDSALTTRDEYLKGRIDALDKAAAWIVRGQPLAANILIGQPVYWNPTTRQFDLALAAVVTDPVTGTLVPSPSSECLGIVVAKTAARVGDIAIAGAVQVSLTNAVSGTVSAGRYYLSSATPGKLTLQRPPVSIPVLYWDGVGTAYVLPQRHQFLESHRHYRIALHCAPAGTPAVTDSIVAINSPDATKPGWLPANHASFNGLAPTGAAFGYNIAAHSELLALFPPVPVEAAALIWDKGVNLVGGTLIPLGLNGLATIDQNGIWWMSNTTGDVPWVEPWTGSEPVVPNNSATPESPRTETMRLVLAFGEMLYATDGSVVTSLRPATGSPIKVQDCSGNAKNTGSLYLDFDFNLLTDPVADDVTGLAIKQLTSAGVFKRGPVVSRLLPGANVVLTGTTSGTGKAGEVTIDVNVDLTGREIMPQYVKLFDAIERSVDTQDALYTGLPAGRASSIVFQFAIPSAGLSSSPMVIFTALLYATVTGTFPSLQFTVRQQTVPFARETTALGGDLTTIGLPSSISMTAGNVVTISSTAVPVTAGSMMFARLSRGASDGYAGEIGLVLFKATLISGS